MYNGKCLCGAVEYQISGGIADIVMCHCSECRRAQGSAFATNGNVKNQDFHLTQGANNLTEFKVNEQSSKFFCKTCGSPLFSKSSKYSNCTRIRLGLIQEDIREPISKHIFVASKANWDILPDDSIERCYELE